MLCPLSIYDDAANRSLRVLKCQFLYDEIEAEVAFTSSCSCLGSWVVGGELFVQVNLCFDQFIWKLAHSVFTHYKTIAAAFDFQPFLISFQPPAPHLLPPFTRREIASGRRAFQLSLQHSLHLHLETKIVFGLFLFISLFFHVSLHLFHSISLIHVIFSVASKFAPMIWAHVLPTVVARSLYQHWIVGGRVLQSTLSHKHRLHHQSLRIW